MRTQALRHLIEVLEQRRINLLEGLRYRILFIDDIEFHIAVVGIHNHLNGVADVVRRLAGDRLRIRIQRAFGISVHHPVEFAVYGHQIRVVFIAQIRHDFHDPFDYVAVDDNLGIAVNIRGHQKLQTALADREYQTVERVQLDARAALVTRVLVAGTVRIVEFLLIGIDNDIFVGQFAEVDLRSVNLNLRDLRNRRNVADQHVRLSA